MLRVIADYVDLRPDLLPRHHGVVKSVMAQPRVAVYAGVTERRVFVPPEREDGLIHLFGVEHLQLHEQVEVLHSHVGNGQEQVRIQDVATG